jgi:ABC-type transport system involved in multi-copper enzyme maturation permease subunit
MNVLPVITRELRSEARHPFTYWLRVLGAMAAFAAALWILFGTYNLEPEGGRMLLTIHTSLHFAIWVLVPLLTADCLSRERREGTLGILFLTPLKPRDIVIAKSVTQGVRALTLVAAAIPVVTLPLLVGGVQWQQAAISICLNAAACSLALAAGLIATALCKSWIRSLTLAMTLAPMLAVGLFLTFGASIGVALSSTLNRASARGFDLALVFWSGLHPRAWDYFTALPNLRISTAALFNHILPAAVVTLLLALGVLALAVVFAAHRVARTWQDRPPHPLVVWLQRQLCQPVMMQGLLHRWTRRTLERNPIGWLEQRSWSGRIVIWGWLAVLIAVYSYALGNFTQFYRGVRGMHTWIGWGLMLSMAFSAANSLRRERETRALELLLVSPLSEAQILFGRLRGLWGQFLPSLTVFFAGWLWLTFELNRGSDLPYILSFAIGFLTVPVIGLFFSLICKNFLTALSLTILIGIIAPSLLFLCGPFGQLIVAGIMGATLHHRLVERRFALEST